MNMRFAILALLGTVGLSAQTLRSLQFGTNPGATTLAGYPLGTYQWSLRLHNLPTATAPADLVFVNVDGIQTCRVVANSLRIVCADSFDAQILGPAVLPFTGLSDIRLVVTRTRDATYGTMQIDLWKGDCTGHISSQMPAPYQNGEPATSSGSFTIGGTGLAVAFFRSTSTPVSPACPADAPAAVGPNMDFRFEGNTLNDVSGKNYTLTAAGSSFVNSPAYAPAAVITGSWTAPRPVVPVAAFTLDGSHSVTSLGNGVPASYAWSQTAGPAASSFSSASAANPTVTPPQDGSYTYQLVVTDSNAATGTATVNVGVVASDANGLKIFANPDLAYVLGPLPRFGVNPWPWYDWTEADDMDALNRYWTAPPAPGTLFTGTGINDAFFTGIGPFAGLTTDTYDVKISATGNPDSYQWRKNGGAFSASLPVTLGGLVTPDSPLTDGVVIQFNSTTGHTLNDQWTRQAPYAGTASISGAAPNHVDVATGYVCASTCGNPITVVGTGTQWLTGTAAQKLGVGDQIWVEWDADGAGSKTGRWLDQVVAVADNTHFTITGAGGYWQIPVSLSGSMTIQKIGPDLAGYTLVSQPSASWNYYEALLGGIRLAAATNLDAYNNQSQAFCNLWWQYGLDHGYRGTIPRNAGYHSMIACAVKYGFNWWDGIAKVIGPASPGSPVARDAGFDIRETSYSTRATALMAHLYPPHTASPAATAATWCGYVTNQTTNYWLNPSTSGGILTTINNGQDVYFQENLCGENCGFPAAGTPPGPPSGATFGTSPWRDSGLSNIALIEAQRVLKDVSGCNNPTLAASVASTIQKSAQFIWDYGRSADGGLFYNAQYLSMQGIHPGDVIHLRPDVYDFPGANVAVAGGTAVTGSGNTFFTKAFAPCNGTSRISINGSASVAVASCADDTHMTLAAPLANGSGMSYYNAGSIAVANGSAGVTGTSTGFVNLFAPCDGTTYLGIRGSLVPPYTDNAVYQVVACPDNTHLTLSRTYGGATQAAITDYSRSNKSSSNCAPSIASQCETDASSGRNLAHDYPVSLSWNLSNGPQWKFRVEYGLGKLYGGSAGGPGSLGPGAGPQADGTTSNFDGLLLPCVTSPTQPCSFSPFSNSIVFGHAAKEFGMSAGAGNARNAIANYLSQSGYGIKVQGTKLRSTKIP